MCKKGMLEYYFDIVIELMVHSQGIFKKLCNASPFNLNLDKAETVKDLPVSAVLIVHLEDSRFALQLKWAQLTFLRSLDNLYLFNSANIFFTISANSEVIFFLYGCCDSCDRMICVGAFKFFVCCIYEFHAFSIIISLVWMDL
ncbi:hypothetical protein BpHYR1_052714 [Brachionus plicatilis]|uniref:Uncharacterized protein n=1 Tax=Brachionus plicatilis TaxID=10195 RepID=A0A3M7SJK8_BRAPC|nr:hypothetical protein BpHYR1_052714 [Brachionus plicatilis]